MGGLGFGLLEHPRQWPGARWTGLYPGTGQSCQARPDEAREPTESVIEAQLEQEAEECPTEIREAVRAEVRTLREQHAQDREALGPPPQRAEVRGAEGRVDTLSTWD